MNDEKRQKLDSIWTDLGDELAKERTSLENDRRELIVKSEQLAAEKEAMAKSGATEGDILELDVGGEMFRVKRGTLLLAPEHSHMYAMFSGRWDESLSRNAEGAIFVDMSPHVFRVILSRLRAAKLNAKPTTWGDLRANDSVYENELEGVLQFFGLVDPILPIVMKACSHGGIDVEDGIVLTKKGAGHKPAVSSGAIPAGSAWKIHIKTVSTWIFAGIIGTATPSESSYGDPTSYGWANNSQVHSGGKQVVNQDGWVGWESNDVAIFKLGSTSLKMYVMRLQCSFVFQLPSERPWRVHVNMHDSGSSVEVSMPTDQEVALLN